MSLSDKDAETLCVSAQTSLIHALDTMLDETAKVLLAAGVSDTKIVGVIFASLATTMFVGMHKLLDPTSDGKAEMSPLMLHNIHAACMRAIMSAGRSLHPDAAEAIRSALNANPIDPDRKAGFIRSLSQ